MRENEVCPGCGRHCSFDNLFCERGQEYFRSGKLPERKHADASCQERRMEPDHNAGINEKLIINLRDISHMMRRQYEGKASQKRILIILHESGMLTQKELTEQLGIQPGSASEILSKLELAGLITRTTNEADRRTTDIRLTDTGAELALDAAKQRQRRHQEMFSCLSSKERQTLLSLLEKIHADWEGRLSDHQDHHHHGKHDAQSGDARKHRGWHSFREY